MTDYVVSESVVFEVLDTVTNTILTDESAKTSVVESVTDNTVVVSETKYEIIETAMQGPAGPPGTAEDEMVYSKRIDFVGEDVIYKGDAAPGASESDAVWRVRKINIGVTGDISEMWAEGNSLFDKAWTDRLSFDYN